MLNFKQAKQIVTNAREIVVASHINPDGDSIGSLLSLGLGLEKLGKRLHFISADGVPKRYSRLPAAYRIKDSLNKSVDLAIAVDCSNKEILGSAWEIFGRAKTIMEIDHHEFRRPFGKISFIDKKAAAVGELVYKLLGELNVSIDKEIAQNLLTSIIVETDSFRLPAVSAFTFEICYRLMKRGVDFYKLSDMVYWSKTKEAIILSGLALARCKFMQRGRIAWSIVHREDFDLVKGKDEDVDTVADELRSIQGVEIVVLFRQTNKEHIRVSLRSKGRINVAGIAEHYGGGGHFDVAGCSIPNSPASMRELLKIASRLLEARTHAKI